jgi:hypothetical protein
MKYQIQESHIGVSFTCKQCGSEFIMHDITNPVEPQVPLNTNSNLPVTQESLKTLKDAPPQSSTEETTKLLSEENTKTSSEYTLEAVQNNQTQETSVKPDSTLNNEDKKDLRNAPSSPHNYEETSSPKENLDENTKPVTFLKNPELSKGEPLDESSVLFGALEEDTKEDKAPMDENAKLFPHDSFKNQDNPLVPEAGIDSATIIPEQPKTLTMPPHDGDSTIYSSPFSEEIKTIAPSLQHETGMPFLSFGISNSSTIDATIPSETKFQNIEPLFPDSQNPLELQKNQESKLHYLETPPVIPPIQTFGQITPPHLQPTSGQTPPPLAPLLSGNPPLAQTNEPIPPFAPLPRTYPQIPPFNQGTQSIAPLNQIPQSPPPAQPFMESIEDTPVFDGKKTIAYGLAVTVLVLLLLTISIISMSKKTLLFQNVSLLLYILSAFLVFVFLVKAVITVIQQLDATQKILKTQEKLLRKMLK